MKVVSGLAALALALAPVAASAAEAVLWLVAPQQPGILQSCQEQGAAAVAARTASRLAGEAEIRWEGGSIPLHGQPVAAAVAPHDTCFALTVDGMIMAAGAVLSPHSARLLAFPVLQAESPRSFVLSPSFPPGQPAPAAWRQVLPTVR